jgi:hypothetical protein
MNEYDLLQPWKNQIGTSREIGSMKPEPKTQCVGHLPNRQLRLGVLASDTSH